jgi:hypothetical protein
LEVDLDPRRLAAQLLSEHRVHLSQAISTQMAELVPRYREVPEADRSRTVMAVLRGFEKMLQGEGQERVLVAIDEVFDKRASEGFSAVDLVLATHAYLPVLRRVLCERAADLREGLRAYDEVERLTLPLLRRVIQLAFESRRSTDPGFTKKPRPGDSWPPSTVIVEPDDDEAPASS